MSPIDRKKITDKIVARMGERLNIATPVPNGVAVALIDAIVEAVWDALEALQHDVETVEKEIGAGWDNNSLRTDVDRLLLDVEDLKNA